MPVTGSKHRGSDEQLCPFCHALLLPGAARCWLCGADVEQAPAHDAAVPSAASQAVPPKRVGTYSLAALMMFVTLFSVVLGVSTLWPGVGIPLGIILLVVWLRTTAVVHYRRAHGHAVTRGEKLHLFFESFATALGMLAITCVAGCAAVIAACFACVGTWAVLGGDKISPGGFLLPSIVFGAVILVIAVPVLRKLAKVIARRWRRDIDKPD